MWTGDVTNTKYFTKTCQHSICKTWSLTIISFPKYFCTAFSISEFCYRFFDTSKRPKRLVSRCYSSRTNAKNSCTSLTAKIFTQSKSIKLPYLPNSFPNSYIIAILKYCHKNVSRENGYPVPPNDMIVVSKTQRHYMNPQIHQQTISTDFIKVYYHFYQACLFRHNTLFTPQLSILPPDMKLFLLRENIFYSQSCAVNIKDTSLITEKTDIKYKYLLLNIWLS